jgi:NAD(P)-dependent dehydrogenase (short-subunit alcohol dehydrogenase family)
MKLDFTDSRVLVTGGTRGIGLAIVEAFLEAGARVAVNGASAEGVAKAIGMLGKSGGVVAATGSIATVEGCRRVVEAARSGLGGIDVLVNNAGLSRTGSIEATDEATWDAVMDVNLKGAFFVTKFALPALRLTKGNIVNIASVSGICAEVGAAAYCASKAALMHLTRCQAMEFAPDIRVNAVCPGAVDTDMARQYSVEISGTVADGYKAMADAAILKRVGRTREIAGPVLYLASDLASYVTGACHVVDGGFSID